MDKSRFLPCNPWLSTGINHIQSCIADALKTRNNLATKRLKPSRISLITREVQIQSSSQHPIRHAREAQQRILDPIPEELLPKQAVIDGRARCKFQIRSPATAPELQV